MKGEEAEGYVVKNINWFPGHMAKALRKMEEDVRLCDGIIYVLDSRAVFACFNKRLFTVFGNKLALDILLLRLAKLDIINAVVIGELSSDSAVLVRICSSAVLFSEKLLIALHHIDLFLSLFLFLILFPLII